MTARLVETHLSLVLLTDDRVLKWKKAVAFDFIDLRTLEARRRNCEREVELNRRLAPRVYEGVAELHGPGGELWEPVVVMQRLPDERRLATLVRADDPAVPDAVAAVARTIADFHAGAATSPEIARHGRADAVARRWAANLRQLRAASQGLPDAARADLDAVEARWTTWLAGRAGLLDSRADGGCVVDGHGDLQADDVFLLPDGPAVIDCLEFDDALRAVDVADDLAFLAMDLEHLGRPDLAADLVTAYDAAAATHGREPLPPPLVHVWAAYRAVVRAMVTALRAGQEDHADPHRSDSLADAAALLGIARRRMEAAEVRLVLVGGSPGSGKSKLARGLAAAAGWEVVRTDDVRRDVLGEAAPAPPPGSAGVDPRRPDRYDPAAVARVYDAVIDRARTRLGAGCSVLLDATWGAEARRAAARRLAAETHARCTELRCTVDPETAARRVARRAEKGTDSSEATPEIARRLAAAFDPWPEAHEIATDGPPGATLAAGLTALGLPVDDAAGLA